MKQDEFINDLISHLSGLSDTEKREILLDYEEYFREGRANGRTDAEIANALGSPFDLAKDILEKYSTTIVPTTHSYGFVTDERSGNSWFKHAWHLFKKAPIFFIIIGGVFGVIDYQIDNSAYYLIYSNLIKSVFASIIVVVAFQCEHGKSIYEFDAHKNNFILLVNFIFASLLWLLLMVAGVYVGSLIGGHEMVFYKILVEKSLAADVFLILFEFLSMLFCFMVSALIIINKVRFDVAYKISFLAGFIYWKQIVISILIGFFWCFLVIIAVFIFLWGGASATNLTIEMGKILGEQYFVLSLGMILASPVMLLNYTAWAAVFRDGSMKNTVNQIN